MKLGTNDIGSVYLGTNAVQKVYLGTNEVWTSFTGLLDTYSGAAAAYSLRKLRSAYTGSAIRVRRSNDNTEQDIGFVNNELDTSALTTFCSGTNGFVKTWYDQSGNANDATQSTAANQPQIVSSGSVILENGKPSVQFTSASSQWLKYNGLIYTTNIVFATSVFSNDASSAFGVILSNNSGSGQIGRSSILSIDNSTPPKSLYFFNNGTSFLNLSSGTISNNVQTLMTNYSFDDDYYNALNGGAANNVISNQSYIPASTSGTGIGANPTFTGFWNGKIQEIVVWNSNESSNKMGIEDNINTYYGIY